MKLGASVMVKISNSLALIWTLIPIVWAQIFVWNSVLTSILIRHLLNARFKGIDQLRVGEDRLVSCWSDWRAVSFTVLLELIECVAAGALPLIHIHGLIWRDQISERVLWQTLNQEVGLTLLV